MEKREKIKVSVCECVCVSVCVCVCVRERESMQVAREFSRTRDAKRTHLKRLDREPIPGQFFADTIPTNDKNEADAGHRHRRRRRHDRGRQRKRSFR